MIDRELPLHAGRILPHRKVHSGFQFSAVGPHFHGTAEGVDVNGKGLEGHFIDTGLFILACEVLPRLVGTVPRITPALETGRTELFDNAFVLRQILGVQRHHGKRQQNNNYLLHSSNVRIFFRLTACTGDSREADLWTSALSVSDGCPPRPGPNRCSLEIHPLHRF